MANALRKAHHIPYSPKLQYILEAPEGVPLDIIVLSRLILDLVVRRGAGGRVDQRTGRVDVEEHLKGRN